MAEEMGTLRKIVEIIAATFEDVTGNAAYSGAPIRAPMCPPQTKNPTAVHLKIEGDELKFVRINHPLVDSHTD